MNLHLSTYRQLWGLLRWHRGLFGGVLILAALTSVVEGLGVGAILTFVQTTPLQIPAFLHNEFLTSLFQYIDARPLVERIRIVTVGLVCFALVRGGLVYGTHLLAMMLQGRVVNDVRTHVFQQVLDVQISFSQRKGQSLPLDILLYATQQIGVAVQQITLVLNSLVTFVLYVVLMLWLAWQLTVLAFVLFVAVAALIEWTFSRPLKRAMARRETLRQQIQAEFFNALTGLKLIHLYAQEQPVLQRLAGAQKRDYVAMIRMGTLLNLRSPLFSAMSTIGMAILLGAATVVLPGVPDAWLGHVLLFVAAALRLLAPANALSRANAQINYHAPALQSVMNFLQRDDKPYLQNGHRPFRALHEGITFSHVTYRYDATEAPVLADVTFTIPRGKVVAVVGPSGAGKSTLVHLLARLADCDAGYITVDGVDLRDLERTSWRRQLAVVSQDTFLFNDTVAANLRFVRPTATEAEMIVATRLAQAHEFIMALPQGYETMLGDRGVRLSGGQQQRLAIARALLVDPQLLILDEATSDLDTETEQAIQVALAEYGHRRTVFVIAHRLSTIRQADTILVLQEGRIVEQGTHEALLHARGAYWRLVQAQHVHATDGTVPSSRVSAEPALH